MALLLLACGLSWATVACGGSDETSSAADDGASSSVPGAGPSSGVSTVASPSTVAPAGEPQAGAGVVPEGFSTVRAEITSTDGEVCEVCLWLADTGDERSRGLMGVTDLGDASGMVFVFDEPTDGGFWMHQTPTPLSIAWFADDAGLVGTADMEPCIDVAAGDCPLYAPDDPYVMALEVFQGSLDALGVGDGARLEIVPGSEASECPAATAGS